MPATSDEPSFEAFVTTRSSALHQAAWLLTGDPQLAEDLLQATLVRVWRRWSRITRDGRDGEAYVRAVLYTTYVSWWRRRSWHERPSEDRPSRLATIDIADAVAVRTTLSQALVGLPRMQRACLVLRYYEDMTIAQAAAVLEVSTGTVTTHVSRGLAAMRGDMTIEGLGGGRHG